MACGQGLLADEVAEGGQGVCRVLADLQVEVGLEETAAEALAGALLGHPRASPLSSPARRGQSIMACSSSFPLFHMFAIYIHMQKFVAIIFYC